MPIINLKEQRLKALGLKVKAIRKDKKLTLVSVKKKDLQKMKVFNFNDEGTDQFYLKMESDYYLLAEPKGKLKRLSDQDIIESLNLKDSE